MYGFLILLGLACIVSAFSVSASLTATSFGFQVIVQNGTTSAFNQDTAATDLESTAISYPTAEGGLLDFGVVNLAFPSISQTLDQA